MNFETALINGASGFVGRALTAHLREQGKRVIVCGRPGASILPTADLAVRIDRPSTEFLREILGTERIDVVFHCAAYGVVPTERDPAEMLFANVKNVGTWTEAAAGIGARAIVYAGSCAEYGHAEPGIPISEDKPLSACGLYGASKAAGGLWGRAVAKRYGVGFQWLRIFGLYGPGEPSYRLLPHLAARLSAGERVKLTAGQQQRDFLYIDDAVRGIRMAADAALDGQTSDFNLCSGKPITVREFAQTVASLVGEATHDLLDFGARDYRVDEQLWMVGNPAKLANVTGFLPGTDVETGIVRTLRAMGIPYANYNMLLDSI